MDIKDKILEKSGYDHVFSVDGDGGSEYNQIKSRVEMNSKTMSGIPLPHTPDTFNPNRPGPVYDFTDAPSDVRSIIHCINFLGDDLVGAEIGVCKGFSFMTLFT